MGILVNDITKPYTVVFKDKKNTITFTMRQLNYATRTMIANEAIYMKQGKQLFDAGKNTFLNLKHSIVDIEGLVDEAGKAWKPAKDGEFLSDAALDDLLSSDFSTKLMYLGNSLGMPGIPKDIVSPVTFSKIEGIEIIQDKEQDKKK